MKKILFLFTIALLFLSSFEIKAQVFNFSVSPQSLAWMPPNVTATAVVTATAAGASTYSWGVVSPPSCAASTTVAAANGTLLLLSFPCCGIYSLTCFAYSPFSIPPINSVSYNKTVTCNVGLNEINGFANDITIFPNPVKNLLSLESEFKGNLDYSIIDLLGRVILKGELIRIKTIDVSELIQGAYFIKFQSEDQSLVKKLIIEK